MEYYVRSIRHFLQKHINAKELHWWIKYQAPQSVIKSHVTFLYCEAVFYLLGLLTFVHAMRNGGRYKWLWLATILHGVLVEMVSYQVPDIDNFWHAQSMIMLLGRKLPLHIVCMYPAFIYTSCVAVSHMNLRWWAEPFAVGLGVLLLDIPFDIMGVKLLWWTWHDDDPNIYDRHYWVPWTSYYFHAAFASSFAFIFHGVRALFCSRFPKFQSSGCFCEVLCAVLTGLLSTPLGVLQFIPIYHPLHDMFGIHSEVCVLLLVMVYIMVIWSADRHPFENARAGKTGRSSEIVLAVLLHYIFYICLVVYVKPEEQRSVGFHQPTGACGVNTPVHTPFGHILKRTKYLCVDGFSEEYFDFKCLSKVPASGKNWYTICGTPFPNHIEYVLVVSAFCVCGLLWYWQLLIRSGPLPRSQPAYRRVKKD